MSDISDLLARDELDARMMASIMGLPKSDFVRMLGDNYIVEKKIYMQNEGLVTYKFKLENTEPRVYRNLGYHK